MRMAPSRGQNQSAGAASAWLLAGTGCPDKIHLFAASRTASRFWQRSSSVGLKRMWGGMPWPSNTTPLARKPNAREMAILVPSHSVTTVGPPPAPLVGLPTSSTRPIASIPETKCSQALAQPIQAGTDVVVQIHYHPSGKPEQDQSALGLRLSGPPTKGRASIILSNRRIDIPAGDSHYVVKASVTVPQDIDLFGITPHAHYLGKDMKVTAHLPDGTTQSLIWIKER